jgi:hypothetical protein
LDVEEEEEEEEMEGLGCRKKKPRESGIDSEVSAAATQKLKFIIAFPLYVAGCAG